MLSYQVDALRTIRSLQDAYVRCGHTAQAEQMGKVGDQVEKILSENKTLRTVMSEATAAIGNGSSCSASASIEFMAGLPKEIEMSVAALRAERAALKEALGDLLDRYIQAIGNEGIECYNARHALRVSA